MNLSPPQLRKSEQARVRVCFRQDGYTHVGGNPRLSVMNYNIFYIIGVIVVVAVILKFLGLY